MVNAALLYVLVLLPLGAFLVTSLLRWVPARYAGGSKARAAGWLNVAAIGVSAGLSLTALAQVLSGGTENYDLFSWLAVPGLEINFGIILDPLTAIMLTLVSVISLLVNIYSLGYMRKDESYARFFAFMALFTTSMLGLVSASNLVQLFVFWELVGVCSYFLIAFWVKRPSAVAAAKKAFIMTRLGDFGFLLALMYISFLNPAWLDIPVLYEAVSGGLISEGAALLVGLGLLFGVVGKSAQLPLHAWLPDAMEGPTPVSALLHSATMVTAGVFLLARAFPLFEYTEIQTVIAVVGLATSLAAATMGMASNDIKRVLAFSTVSQIGYMVFALGTGAYAAAIFHLFIHGFFKAGLFMAAGNVGHAVHTFDMRAMGGLRKRLPWTYALTVVCGLSLAALPPLSGFWSKDEILTAGFENGWAVGSILLLAVSVMTAFYTFRMIFLTFHGKPRGEQHGSTAPESEESIRKPSFDFITLVLPIGFLAVCSVLIGYLINPVWNSFGAIAKHGFSHFITSSAAVFRDHDAVVAAGGEPEFSFLVAALSIATAAAGLAAAYWIYGRGGTTFTLLPGAAFRRVRAAATNQYYINELYEQWVARRFTYGVVAGQLAVLEDRIIDRANRLTAKLTMNMGRNVSRFQSGQLQAYASIMFVGMLVAVAVYLVLTA